MMYKLLSVILLILFFISGASALIYQVLWLRILGLTFGVSVYAATCVLASFMSGLAIGSFLAGKLADRGRNPFVLFGIIELSIGLSVLFTLTGFDAVKLVYKNLYLTLPQIPAVSISIRFILSFLVLVIPASLMGMTLPVVVKSYLLHTKNLGKNLSLLYAVNTAGAVAGTLLSGLYLIGELGMKVTFNIAMILNVFVGLSALTVSYFIKDKNRLRADHSYQDNTVPLPSYDRKLVLVVFVLSGFASIAMEVVWFRSLTLFFPMQTTYGYTIMLATILSGIALGSYLITPLMSSPVKWTNYLAVLEFMIGIFALTLFGVLTYLYDIINAIELVVGHPLSRNFPLMILTSMVGIFPVAVLLGVAFPIGLKVWTTKGKDLIKQAGNRVGLFYSLNVLAGIIGSIVAGFVLLPLLGSKASMIILSSLFIVSAFLLIYKQIFKKTHIRLLCLSSLLVYILAAFLLPNPLTVAIVRRFPGEKILWQEEGIQATVSVHQQQNSQRIMYLDGVSQANDSEGMAAVHRGIGHFPMLLHPKTKDVLVVGLGGGATAGAISKHQGINIDVVELSQSVLGGSNFFTSINDHVLEKKNLQVIIDDARSYLLLTPKRYDLIIADIQPYHAGAGKLYSAEYFHLVKDALKEDGIMLQWIGQRPKTEYKLIMRTFLEVFPNASLWYNGTLLIGPRSKLEINNEGITQKLKEPALQQDLRELNFNSVNSILSTHTANSADIKGFVGEGLVLTDDRPMIEYYFFALPRNEESVVMPQKVIL